MRQHLIENTCAIKKRDYVCLLQSVFTLAMKCHLHNILLEFKMLKLFSSTECIENQKRKVILAHLNLNTVYKHVTISLEFYRIANIQGKIWRVIKKISHFSA